MTEDGRTIEREQGGQAYTPYYGSHYLRHAQLTTWWERILAVISLAFAVITITNLVIRNLF